MDCENNNSNLNCLQTFLIIAIITTACLVPAWALINRNLQQEPAAIIIGQEAPAVEPTPNPVFIALIEQAKASAKVQVIQAESEAQSQATDDEIRLRWNIHHMRRFWAWYAVPVGFIFIGLGLYIWGLYQHR
jgi:hypothetical protein